ncbi:PPOX class F420-dependent oxidoreductase [Streptomyces sp. NBC_00083]|uniref:PPOX class F420-dependent oxidoreductase n=1 Tax=Streptomyces sp. NBC_00083 TaxID=2975647 RepID=UPI002258B0FD|nr:PPOX class F420-dependent oxidoreductase [Streptomyces sp. NBC_00083]MCX5382348.1 PPOX class F420-dependent oxidoreductase [Streptomyces sp. NBC_00083]
MTTRDGGAAGAARTDAVWVIRDGPALGILVPTSSPLAGRLRAGSRVLVGAGAGTLWVRPVFLDAEGSVRYRVALIDKYGLAAVVRLAHSRLRHGLAGTVGVRLPAGADGRRLIGPDWRPSGTYSLN